MAFEVCFYSIRAVFIQEAKKKMKWILKMIWEKLDGWKSILGWLTIQFPWLGSNPLIIESFHRCVSAFALKDWATFLPALAEFLGQVLLTVGLIHKKIKYS